MKSINNVLIVIIILSILSTIGFVYAEDSLTFDENGISFDYPSTWQKVKASSENSKAAICLKEDADICIIVQEVPSRLGTNISNAYLSNKGNLSAIEGYSLISENQTTISGKSVIVHRYMATSPKGVQKEYVATWLNSNDKSYVILFSTPAESYDQYYTVYENVLNTFESENNILNSITNPLNELISNI